ncbi:MAG: hypothetical protein KZQ83_08940 [gamma proteobacterium symbiont of Taylorina sp.]|nr:hypothetical protein [gamma proteobacterium symbiont of Taylorina sp.]
MTLEEIWLDFTGKVAEVELLLRATRSAVKTEMQLLLKNEDALNRLSEGTDTPISMHNMSFRDLRTGQHNFYDHRKLSIDEAKLHLLMRKNKQYQWLLVEVYEAFEKYLVHIYALVGFKNLDCWPMRDYGNVTILEAQDKSFLWYVDQARKKGDLPQSIIKPLQKKFPRLADVEQNNIRDIHLGFVIAFIAQLRHQIVHNAGWTISKEELILKVGKKIGLYNNGQIDEPLVDFANDFFGSGEHENMVALLEVATNTDIPLDTYVCRVRILIEIILGYSNFILQIIKPSIVDPNA